jgi:membrane protease YdiL (CAAX protease family)
MEKNPPDFVPPAMHFPVSDAVALILAMIFPSIMTFLEFRVLMGTGLESNPVVQMLFYSGKVVQFAFPIVYVLICHRKDLKWNRPSKLGIQLGLGFGLMVAVGALVLYFVWLKHTPLMQDTAVKVNAWLQTMNLATPMGYVVIAVFMSIAHSFLEEYYWRWFVFGWLEKYWPLAWAVGLSSVAFMAHHVVILSVYMPGGWRFWAGVVPFSLCVAGGGVVWAWIYHRTQSIYGPWFSHLLVDAALMGLGYDLVSRLW